MNIPRVCFIGKLELALRVIHDIPSPPFPLMRFSFAIKEPFSVIHKNELLTFSD